MTSHTHFLREFTKFAAGLVTADFIIGTWLYTTSVTPFNFEGILFTDATFMAWLVFDLVLIAILVHYGWHADIHAPTLKQRTFFLAVGVIMGLVGVAHFLRVILGVEVSVAGWMVPLWISWVGTLVALYLSYTSFKFSTHKKR